jgi:hypothetical protein
MIIINSDFARKINIMLEIQKGDAAFFQQYLIK